MPNIVQRYPATTLAAVVALALVVTGAAVFLSADDTGTSRLGLIMAIIGPTITTILATNRGESATNAARRADVNTTATGEILAAAVADGRKQSPAVLNALARLVEATERAERAAVAVENVANGHASGDLQTRSGD